jgi:aldehyde dehydrogenase (NAD+)
LAVRRIFLQRGIRDRFLASFKRLLEAAPPVRLALEAQRTDARRLVASAIADGASCLVEPSAEEAEGSMRPVVVIDARPDMALCREAPFAPVCAVLPFDSREGALAAEAACPFALGAAVFTADRRQAEWFAARLRAGVVSVNDVIAPTGHPATPLGGRGASGWGVTQGQEGLLEMTVPQVVSVRGGSFRPHYDLTAGRPETQEPLVRALLQAGHARTWMGRLRGWRQLAQAGRELRSGQSR